MAKGKEPSEQEQSISRVAQFFGDNTDLIVSYLGYLATKENSYLLGCIARFSYGLIWNNRSTYMSDLFKAGYNVFYDYKDLFLKNPGIQKLVISKEFWEKFSDEKDIVAGHIIKMLKISEDKDNKIKALIEAVLGAIQQDFLEGINKESMKKIMTHASVLVKAASDKKKKLDRLLQEVNDATKSEHRVLSALISELGLENKGKEILDLISESDQEKKEGILSTVIDESKSKLDKEKEKNSLFALIDEGFKFVENSPQLKEIIFGEEHKKAIASIVSQYAKTDVINPVMAILNFKSFSAAEEAYKEYRNNKNIKLDGVLMDLGIREFIASKNIWQALSNNKDDIAKNTVKALKIYKDKGQDEVKAFISTLADVVGSDFSDGDNRKSVLEMMNYAATIFKLNLRRKKQIDDLVAQIDKSKSNMKGMKSLINKIQGCNFEQREEIFNLVHNVPTKADRVNSLFTLVNKAKLANEELLSKIKKSGLDSKKEEILNLINEPDDKKRKKALSGIIKGVDRSKLINDKRKLLFYQIEESVLENLVNKSKLAKDELFSQAKKLGLNKKKQEILDLIDEPDNKQQESLSSMIDDADREVVKDLIDEPELDKKERKDSLFSLIDKGFELIKNSKQLQKTIFDAKNHKAMSSMVANFMSAEVDITKAIGAILTEDNLAAIEESYNEYKKSKNPNLGIFLKNTKIQELILNPRIWNTVKENKTALAKYVVDKLGFSKEQDKAKQSVEKLMDDVSQLFLRWAGENILQNIAILANEKESDDEKTKSLTRILRHGEELVPLITSPELWQLVDYKKDEIVDFAVSALKLPKEQQQEATELFRDLIQISSGISLKENKELIKNIMKTAADIADPEKDDTEKMVHSFELLDQAIQFIEFNTSENIDKTNFKELQKHKSIIAKMLAPYMPPGIKSETIVNDILFNKETLKDLRKAYDQYKNSNVHMFGAIKAIVTVMKSSKLRSLAMTMACNWFVSKMPNFIRRRYANKKINEVLKNKTNNNSLNLDELCAKNSADTKFLEKYSLNSRCLKGLNIRHSLDDLRIKGFNFNGAILGSSNEDFSLADSKISNTDFKNVQFKGKSIDISGMEIDEKSFISLLPLLEECQQKGILEVNNKIKVTGVTVDLMEKIENSGIYKSNKNMFEVIQSSKKVKPEKTFFQKVKSVPRQVKSASTFVNRLGNARNKAKNNTQNVTKK